MKTFKILLVVLSLVFLFPGYSVASTTLFDWAFSVDGVSYEFSNGDSMPTTGGSLNASGLGSLTWFTDVSGAHRFVAFFDHEIDQPINTYFNEYGETHNLPVDGQSWEIDEPGYVFGNIYANVLGGSLDNTNAVPFASPDDVSMAMEWNFSLNPGDTALITLTLSAEAPLSGFYLAHRDIDVQEAVYFSGNLDITPIPLPGTMLLFGSGLLGLLGIGRKRLLKGKN